MIAPVEVLKKAYTDRKGAHIFSVRLLHEFGKGNGYLNPSKIRDLWLAFRENPVIFTDEVEGDFERFLEVITNTNSVWFEIFDELSEQCVGVYCLTDIFPGYEATGHFGFWDRVASGRERLTWQMMNLVFQTYDLNRMTAEIPAYQTGTIRTAEKLGFRREGLKRGAVKRNGEWKDLVILGILRSELAEVSNGTAKTA